MINVIKISNVRQISLKDELVIGIRFFYDFRHIHTKVFKDNFEKVLRMQDNIPDDLGKG